MTGDVVNPEVNGSSTTRQEKITPLRIWLCSQARTASNVLAKQLRDHPQLAAKEYTFMKTFIDGPEALAGEMTNPEAPIEGAEDATYQKGFNEMMDAVAKAEQDVSHVLKFLSNPIPPPALLTHNTEYF